MRGINVLMAAVDVKSSLESVLRKVEGAVERHLSANKIDADKFKPCIVAVGKTKPPELLEEAYSFGQRHFGENYVQELVQKADYFKFLPCMAKSGFLVTKEAPKTSKQHQWIICPFNSKGLDDIKWHFIGKLQRNKSNNLCAVPNLYMVQTVDSVKLADALNRSWERLSRPYKLKILVQINTSEEESKGGCSGNEVDELVNHVREKCGHLELAGLMSIGAVGHDYSQGPNPDFQKMVSVRDELCRTGSLAKDQIELSMGMSADFEQAILMGSTIVRIGSTIFGAREYAKMSASKQVDETKESTNTNESIKEKGEESLKGTHEDSIGTTAMAGLKISK